MNGSGHLEEDFRQPLHLCPVDLRKLMTVLESVEKEKEDKEKDIKERQGRGRILQRYKELLVFYKKVQFEKEASWMQDRIKFVENVL